jgi:hypothetical protein
MHGRPWIAARVPDQDDAEHLRGAEAREVAGHRDEVGAAGAVDLHDATASSTGTYVHQPLLIPARRLGLDDARHDLVLERPHASHCRVRVCVYTRCMYMHVLPIERRRLNRAVHI